jgi:hypothetical protein
MRERRKVDEDFVCCTRQDINEERKKRMESSCILQEFSSMKTGNTEITGTSGNNVIVAVVTRQLAVSVVRQK